jgi:hypothetical protein
VRDGIEYVAILNFVLFVNTADLVPIVNYAVTFNPRETPFMIVDGNSSFDPTALSAGTTDIPVKCNWECPPTFNEVCNSMTTQRISNGCILNITSASIISSSNY